MSKTKKKILKTTREKDHITCSGTEVKLKKISYSESMRTRHYVERGKKKKNNEKLDTENSILYETTFKNDAKLMTFFQKKKIRELLVHMH